MKPLDDAESQSLWNSPNRDCLNCNKVSSICQKAPLTQPGCTLNSGGGILGQDHWSQTSFYLEISEKEGPVLACI